MNIKEVAEITRLNYDTLLGWNRQDDTNPRKQLLIMLQSMEEQDLRKHFFIDDRSVNEKDKEQENLKNQVREMQKKFYMFSGEIWRMALKERPLRIRRARMGKGYSLGDYTDFVLPRKGLKKQTWEKSITHLLKNAALFAFNEGQDYNNKILALYQEYVNFDWDSVLDDEVKIIDNDFGISEMLKNKYPLNK